MTLLKDSKRVSFTFKYFLCDLRRNFWFLRITKKINIFFMSSNNFFWFYKSCCTFKFPIQDFTLNGVLGSLTSFYVKKHKNYFKFSALNFEKIFNFQWGSIYNKAILRHTNNSYLDKKPNSSLFIFISIKMFDIVLFNSILKKLPTTVVNARSLTVKLKSSAPTNFSFYKNNYMSYTTKKSNKYSLTDNVELVYFKIKLLRLRKFKGVSLVKNFNGCEEPSPQNVILNQFVVNFLKHRLLTTYSVHIRNKNLIFYDLTSRLFYNNKTLQASIQKIMLKLVLYEKFFSYKKKEVMLLRQNELLLLNNKKNNYIDWRTKNLSVEHLLFFNKVRLTCKKKINSLRYDVILPNLEFLALFNDKDVDTCYLPNNIKVRRLFYNKNIKKFVYFRRIRHFVKYLQNTTITAENNYIYQIWKKASIIKNLSHLWFKFKKKSKSRHFVKKPIRGVVNIYDSAVLHYYGKQNVKRCYIPKGLKYTNVYTDIPNFLVNSPNKNVISLLRNKLIRSKKQYKHSRWFPSDELMKFFLTKKKTLSDTFKCTRVSNLKLTLSYLNFNNFSNKITVFNPFLLELFENEDPLHCFIPETVTIYHIFINIEAIRLYYYSTPTLLLRGILVSRQNLNTDKSLFLKKNKNKSYYRVKVPSYFSKWTECAPIFNSNFFNFLEKTDLDVFLKNNKLSTDIVFLDGFSRNYFKNTNLVVLTKVILKKKYYLWTSRCSYENDGSLHRFVTKELLAYLNNLKNLGISKKTVKLQRKPLLSKTPVLKALKRLRHNAKISRNTFILKNLSIKYRLAANRLLFYKTLKNKIKGWPISFREISLFYNKKLFKNYLMFESSFIKKKDSHIITLKKKPQRFSFFNTKLSYTSAESLSCSLFSEIAANSKLVKQLFLHNSFLLNTKFRHALKSIFVSILKSLTLSTNIFHNNAVVSLQKIKPVFVFFFIIFFKTFCSLNKINIVRFPTMFNSSILKTSKYVFNSNLSHTHKHLGNYNKKKTLVRKSLVDLSLYSKMRVFAQRGLFKYSRVFHILLKKKARFRLLNFFFNIKKKASGCRLSAQFLKKSRSALSSFFKKIKIMSFDIYSKKKRLTSVNKLRLRRLFFKNSKIRFKFKQVLSGFVYKRKFKNLQVLRKFLIAVVIFKFSTNSCFTDQIFLFNNKPLSRLSSRLSLFFLTISFSYFSYFKSRAFASYILSNRFFAPSANFSSYYVTAFSLKSSYVAFPYCPKKLKPWVLYFLYLVKPGFLLYISNLSSFLNSLFFFIKKQRLGNFFNKFWVDRGFFFPVEISLFKFFFLYYTNFFFNFFEVSAFLNFNAFYKQNYISKGVNPISPLSTNGLTSKKQLIPATPFKKLAFVASTKVLPCATPLNKFYFINAVVNFFNKKKSTYLITCGANREFFNFLTIRVKTWYSRYFRKTRSMLKNLNFSKFSYVRNIFKFNVNVPLAFFFFKKKKLKKKKTNIFNITYDYLNNNFLRCYRAFSLFKTFIRKTVNLLSTQRKQVKTRHSFFFKNKSCCSALQSIFKKQSVANVLRQHYFSNANLLRLSKIGVSFKKRLWKSLKKKTTTFFKKKKKSSRLFSKKTLSFFNTKSSYKNKFLLNKSSTGFFSSNHFKTNTRSIFDCSKILYKQQLVQPNIQSFFIKNKINSNSKRDDFFIENYFFKPQSVQKNKNVVKPGYTIKKKNIIFKIKPGYKVLWRQYRQEYKLITNLSYYRQRRLTNYFLNFKKSNGVAFLKNFEFSIFSLLRRSTVFLDYAISSICFSLGMVFLNGQKVLNKLFQVYVGDRVQIVLNYSYLLQFKWFFSFINMRKVKFLTKYIKYFFNIKNSFLALRKRLIRFSEKLFKKLLYLGNDIPNYLEVDFMTMLIVIVYDPFLFCEFDPVLIFRVPFLSIRLYNWKYIN